MKKNLLLLTIVFIFATFIIPHIFINQNIQAKADAEFVCSIDSDCPIGTCLNGKEFPQYSCLNGTCNQILYFVDPCLDLSSSSSSSGSTTSSPINPSFSGTWRGKLIVCPNIVNEDPTPAPTVSNDCLVCPQVEILCTKDSIRIPQTCSHCQSCEKCMDARNLFLKTCVKDDLLSGNINIEKIINNGEITSTDIQSPEQITIAAIDKQNRSVTVSLVLDNQRHLSGNLKSLSSYNQINARKIRFLKNCKNSQCEKSCGDKCCKKNEDCLVLESFPLQYKCSPSSSSTSSTSSSSGICQFPDCVAPPPGCNYVPEETSSGCPMSCGTLVCSSSGDISNCDPKGSCRGENGEELPCPAGTECSGLPAYGCYPPGCPVPICCSEDTNILTPKGQVKINKIKKGDYITSDNGEPAIVVETRKVKVYNHKVMKVELDDGTTLEISPGHPTGPDSMKIGALKPGYKLDGRKVLSAKEIPYNGSHTYDILPYSLTGNYYANGVKIGSSLYMSTLIKQHRQW